MATYKDVKKIQIGDNIYELGVPQHKHPEYIPDGNDNQTVVIDGVSFEANDSVKIVEGTNIAITANKAQKTATIGVTGLAKVATTGSYSDLSSKPSGTLTIVSNNVTVATFSASSTTNVTATIDVPVVHDWAESETKPSYTLDEIEDTESYVKMTSAERSKLTDIDDGANKTTVDTTLSSSSTNPVQNKVVYEALNNKVGIVPGKGLSTNDYTTTEKNKLEGIAEGAEVNQNAFAKITIGSTTINADAKQDTLTLTAGNNITLTPNADNDSIIITATDTAKAVETINGKTLKFFAGEQSEYDDLDDAQKENLYAVVTDDKTYDNIIEEIAALNARLDAFRHPYKPTMQVYGTTLYVNSPGADAFRVKLERADGTSLSMEQRFTADEADAGIDINTYSPTYIGASKAYVITAQACSWGKLASQVSVLTYIPPEPEDPEEPWVPEPSYSLSGDYIFNNYLDTPSNEFEESVQFIMGSDYNGNPSEYAKMVYRDGVLYARSSAGTDVAIYLFNTIPPWMHAGKNITVIRTDNLSKEFYEWFIGNTTSS